MDWQERLLAEDQAYQRRIEDPIGTLPEGHWMRRLIAEDQERDQRLRTKAREQIQQQQHGRGDFDRWMRRANPGGTAVARAVIDRAVPGVGERDREAYLSILAEESFGGEKVERNLLQRIEAGVHGGFERAAGAAMMPVEEAIGGETAQRGRFAREAQQIGYAGLRRDVDEMSYSDPYGFLNKMLVGAGEVAPAMAMAMALGAATGGIGTGLGLSSGAVAAITKGTGIAFWGGQYGAGIADDLRKAGASDSMANMIALAAAVPIGYLGHLQLDRMLPAAMAKRLQERGIRTALEFFREATKNYAVVMGQEALQEAGVRASKAVAQMLDREGVRIDWKDEWDSYVDGLKQAAVSFLPTQIPGAVGGARQHRQALQKRLADLQEFRKFQGAAHESTMAALQDPAVAAEWVQENPTLAEVMPESPSRQQWKELGLPDRVPLEQREQFARLVRERAAQQETAPEAVQEAAVREEAPEVAQETPAAPEATREAPAAPEAAEEAGVGRGRREFLERRAREQAQQARLAAAHKQKLSALAGRVEGLLESPGLDVDLRQTIQENWEAAQQGDAAALQELEGFVADQPQTPQDLMQVARQAFAGAARLNRQQDHRKATDQARQERQLRRDAVDVANDWVRQRHEAGEKVQPRQKSRVIKFLTQMGEGWVSKPDLRRLGYSEQYLAKTLGELEQLGQLQQAQDAEGNVFWARQGVEFREGLTQEAAVPSVEAQVEAEAPTPVQEQPAAAEAPAPVSPATPQQVADQYIRLAQGQWGKRVRLADLRKAFPEMTREQFDESILAMERADEAILYPLDDPKEIGQADRDAAVRNTLGNERHIIFLERAPRAAEATPEASAPGDMALTAEQQEMFDDPAVQRAIRAEAESLARRNPGVEADDLAQAGLMAAVEAARTFDPRKGVRFPAWARRLARQEMLKQLRGERHEAQLDEGAEPVVEGRLHPEAFAEDQQARVQDALTQLPKKEAELLSRAYGIGQAQETQAQIARTMGVSQQAISNRIEKAKARMAAVLAARELAQSEETHGREPDRAGRGTAAAVARADRGDPAPLSERGHAGAVSPLILADESTREVQYFAVETGALTPSHDARRGFRRNEGGDLNERPYHDKVQGASSRQTVFTIAKADPGRLTLLVTDTPTPIDGPPIANKLGIVLVGNARTMGVQLAYHQGGEQAQRVKQTMVVAAQKFGLDRDAVARMQQPIIVRVIDDAGKPGELSALLNEALTTGRTQATQAVSRGHRVSQETADMISIYLQPDSSGESPTIRNVLQDGRKANFIVQRLQKDGVWTQRDVDQFVDPKTQAINEDGKTAIEQALLGKVIQDAAILGAARPKARQNVLAGLAPLTRLIADPKHGARMAEIVQNAVEAYGGYKDANRSLQDYFFRQQTLVPFAGQGDESVAAMVYALDTMGPRKFRTAMAEAAEFLGIEVGADQAMLFETAERASTVDEAVAMALPDSMASFGKAPAADLLGLLPGTRGAIPGGKQAMQFLQRFFTSRGELPESVFMARVARDGRVQRELRKARFLAKDLERVVKKALGGREMDQATLERMDAALKGDPPHPSLTYEVRDALAAMRQHVDALSARLIQLGAAQGHVEAVIQQNLGTYLHRSYRVYDNPKWPAAIPWDVRNRAVAFLEQQFPQKSNAEIEGLIEMLLYEGKAAEQQTVASVFSGSKLGQKDLAVLLARKDIPEEIRALWGEYKDPTLNYVRSIYKMTYLAENHRFLSEVCDAGLGKFFHHQPLVTAEGTFRTRIAADDSSVMRPLNGLYTTSEIKQAFERAMEPTRMPDWLRTYYAINGIVKYAKTVGSLMTHVRNFTGNTSFAVMNGHWRVGHARQAWRATLTNLADLSDQGIRDYLLYAMELGVIGQDVRAGELRAAIRDASKMDIDEYLYNAALRQERKMEAAVRRGLRTITELYQNEDAIWKLYAWENEKARYRKALPNATQEEIDRRTAEIVWRTYPTYSMIPEGVQAIRRFPLVGTFVSFPAEVVRTFYHTALLARQELADPQLRTIGAERLAGMTVALTLSSVAAAALRNIFGVSPEDEENLRKFLPPWQENSQLFHFGRDEEGKFTIVDMRYSDPHSVLKTPFVAFLRGEDPLAGSTAALQEFLEPFVSEEILFKAFSEWWTNRTDSGRPIYSRVDAPPQQARSTIEHFWQAIEPGTLTSLRRIYMGATGQQTATGRSFDTTQEALAVLSGQRIQEVDVPQAFWWRVRDFQRELGEVQDIMRSTAYRRGQVPTDTLVADFDRMEIRRQQTFERMHETVNAAIRLGVDRDAVIESLSGRGVSQEMTDMILTGTYRPYRFSRPRVDALREAGLPDFEQRLRALRAAEERHWEAAGLADELEQERRQEATSAARTIAAVANPGRVKDPEGARQSIENARVYLDAVGADRGDVMRWLREDLHRAGMGTEGIGAWQRRLAARW